MLGTCALALYTELAYQRRLADPAQAEHVADLKRKLGRVEGAPKQVQLTGAAYKALVPCRRQTILQIPQHQTPINRGYSAKSGPAAQPWQERNRESSDPVCPPNSDVRPEMRQ